MGNIIHHLVVYNQYLLQIIFDLLTFIARYIPLKQKIHDDSMSPKYQKFKVDRLPIIKRYEKVDWQFLQEYYKWKYGKEQKPIRRRKTCGVGEDVVCPRCHAPADYIYDNNGGRGECLCKICGELFVPGHKTTALQLKCPYCRHSLVRKKDRSCFVIHKCVNPKCSYYRNNLKLVPKGTPKEDRHKYKLHYIYREFSIDFFKMDMTSLPKNAFSLQFRKHNAHIMGLCLTYSVNLGLSLRKTALALKEIHGIDISHTTVENYCRTAAALVRPFLMTYPFKKSSTFIADETYIKIKGVKAYVWFIMDAISRSIIGYRVSDNRGVAPCIMAMRMAFQNLKSLPENFRFIADGYSAYPLAAQQFALREDDPLKFDITQVIGLTNDDPVTKEFRPFKQMVERLNRTFNASYRNTCGYEFLDSADDSVSLWVAYYNFLRPHSVFGKFHTLNSIEMLDNADLMQDKWLLLIFLAQKSCALLETQFSCEA